MKTYVEEQQISYPVAHDSEGKTVKSYGGNSYPDYFLIDRAENLRFADLANGELDRAVAALPAEAGPETADAPSTKDPSAPEPADQPAAGE